MKKNVLIIGLGRFGRSLASILVNNDLDVVVVDSDQKAINEFGMSYHVDNAMVLDSTNFDILSSSVPIDKFDNVIVAITDIEGSLLTCANLKDLNAKNIFAKAQNKTHERLLKSLGIHNVIFPEKDSAIMASQMILFDSINIIKKGNEVTILSVVNKNDKLVGLPIIDVEKNNFKIFAIKPNAINSKVIWNFNSTTTTLNKLDKLFIVCQNEKLSLIKKTFKS